MLEAAFLVALAIGTAAQVLMVVAGHWIDFVKDSLFAPLGVVISLAAGLIYARAAGTGRPHVLMFSALVGGLCALIGVAVSVLLGDTEPMILAVGTVSSAVGGLLGGFIGKLTTRRAAESRSRASP